MSLFGEWRKIEIDAAKPLTDSSFRIKFTLMSKQACILPSLLKLKKIAIRFAF